MTSTADPSRCFGQLGVQLLCCEVVADYLPTQGSENKKTWQQHPPPHTNAEPRHAKTLQKPVRLKVTQRAWQCSLWFEIIFHAGLFFLHSVLLLSLCVTGIDTVCGVEIKQQQFLNWSAERGFNHTLVVLDLTTHTRLIRWADVFFFM